MSDASITISVRRLLFGAWHDVPVKIPGPRTTIREVEYLAGLHDMGFRANICLCHITGVENGFEAGVMFEGHRDRAVSELPEHFFTGAKFKLMYTFIGGIEASGVGVGLPPEPAEVSSQETASAR